jgi:hypothetical protein
MVAQRLSGGVQDPQLGKTVGQCLVLKRPQDGVICLGRQIDEIALDVRARDTGEEPPGVPRGSCRRARRCRFPAR